MKRWWNRRKHTEYPKDHIPNRFSGYWMPQMSRCNPIRRCNVGDNLENRIHPRHEHIDISLFLIGFCTMTNLAFYREGWCGPTLGILSSDEHSSKKHQYRNPSDHFRIKNHYGVQVILSSIPVHNCSKRLTIRWRWECWNLFYWPSSNDEDGRPLTDVSSFVSVT